MHPASSAPVYRLHHNASMTHTSNATMKPVSVVSVVSSVQVSQRTKSHSVQQRSFFARRITQPASLSGRHRSAASSFVVRASAASEDPRDKAKSAWNESKEAVTDATESGSRKVFYSPAPVHAYPSGTLQQTG